MNRDFWRFYLVVLLSMIAVAMGIEGLLSLKEEKQSIWLPANEVFCAQKVDTLCVDHIPRRLSSLPASAFSLSPQTRQQLEAQGIIAIKEQNQRAYLLAHDSQNQYWRYGPLPLPADDTPLGLYLYLAFFGALALLLLWWLWPLFRDLGRLRNIIEDAKKTSAPLRFSLSRRSKVAPVANAIERLSEQIQQNFQSQRDMTHFIAHDLRTPLSRMRFALAMLQTDNDDLRKDMLDNILEMERITTEYLRFAEQEAHTPVLALSLLNAADFCTEIQRKWPPAHDRITLQVKHSGADWFHADGFSLQRALANLLDNAVRFAQQNISITLKINHDVCVLRVDDDGPGVPLMARHHFAQAFHNQAQIRSEREKGFGLGLYIVLRVAQLHRGQMKVLSAPTLGGARFELIWPNRE